MVEDGGDLGLGEVFDLVEDDCGNAPVLDCVVGFGWDLGEWEWELGGGEFGEHLRCWLLICLCVYLFIC